MFRVPSVPSVPSVRHSVRPLTRPNRPTHPRAIPDYTHIFLHHTPVALVQPKPAQPFPAPPAPALEWTYNDFVEAVDKNEVQSVYIPKDLHARFLTNTEEMGTVQLFGTESIVERLLKHHVTVQYLTQAQAQTQGQDNQELAEAVLRSTFQFIGLVIIFNAIGMLLMRGNGSSGPFNFTKNIGKEYNPETNVPVTFADVAGVDTAKEDLSQVIDFLNNTENYTKLGARIPKGVLLVGPPGTGKTLLARAVAGEAGVPFFSCSASEFIEMFVGVGASRIRELFKKAKEKAPCIIFMDEIDAIGKQRSGSFGPSNDERDQTINQLLTEMDGFTDNQGIILIAATNRPELLDDALTRPGRFDRRVMVDLPNNAGRSEILNLYLKKKQKPLAPDVDIEKLAKMTTGFSGAELENLCNEAAIFSARNKKDQITQEIFESTLDKLTLGAETKNNLITPAKKELIAYHEAGHTLLGMLMGDFDNFRKVSIVSRGSAGGITFFEPNEERVDMSLYTREYLENQLIVFMGGRAAEEITFGTMKITTGATNDLERATKLAYDMVTQFGFNETIGPMNLQNEELGGSIGQDVAGETKYILEQSYTKATSLLREYESYLRAIAKELMDKETLEKEDICRILEGISCKQCVEEVGGDREDLDGLDKFLDKME